MAPRLRLKMGCCTAQCKFATGCCSDPSSSSGFWFPTCAIAARLTFSHDRAKLLGMVNSPLSKAELTRAQIVDSAVAMARHAGLESLTIGAVAERAGLSKSGVFSRVGSQELQLAALKEYERRFIEQVIAPSLREPRGLPRMRELLRRWLQRMADTDTQGGCLFASGAFEYDDQPGPMRDAVVDGLQQMRRHLARTLQQAVDEGQVRADIDAEEVAFSICSLMLGVHHDAAVRREARRCLGGGIRGALAGVPRDLIFF